MKKFRTPKFIKKLATKKPDFLFYGGVIMIVGGTAAAVYSAFKAKDDLAEMKEEIEEINNDEELTEEECEKKERSARVKTYAKIGGRFLLTAAIEGTGIVMVSKSRGIYKSTITNLGVALNGVLSDFKKYRGNVVADLGEEADKKYRFGITEAELTEMDEDGVETHKSIKVADPNNPGYSIYARFFDESSKQWSSDPEENMATLIQTQNVFNDMLRTQGYVFLNDVYAELGFEKTKIGQQVGWVKGLGDGYIDFGITDIYTVPDYAAKAKQRFVNGYENVILLDFNVDGYIIDKIGW